MAVIPGEATEIRYRRTGPRAGRYYHRFQPGVRMRANRDGSVTLRGPRKIHATEDEAGFWRKYGGRAHGENARRRRRVRVVTRGGSPWPWLFGFGLLWMYARQTPPASPADGGGVTVSLSDQLRSFAAPGFLGPPVLAPAPGDVSTSDVVRTIQAQGEALAVAADAGASYAGLSDLLRSSAVSSTMGEVLF